MKIKITFNFEGKAKSIVVNHEEQDFLPVLRKRKVFGFSASDDEIRFLSEEEYFDLVILEFNNKKINLKDVKRTKIDKKTDDWHVKLSFKSVS